MRGVRCALYEAGPQDAQEAVVFVHGNPGPLDDWEDIAPRVARFARVIAVDLPAFGRAERPRDFPFTVRGYADYLGALLDLLNVQRVHLVAHDFGGAWAAQWALDRPHALASITLIATPLCGDFRWHFWAAVWQTPLLGELLQATSWPGLIRWVMTRDNPRPFPNAFVQRLLKFADRAQKFAILDLYRSCQDPAASFGPLADGLAALDPPACIIWGARDPYAKLQYAESHRRLFSRSELHVIENAGHWPFVDEPALVAERVCSFLHRQLKPTTILGATPA